jgi:GntR family transcriptional regulator, transcriptional repressor for pyruvate dehydrogenase complex
LSDELNISVHIDRLYEQVAEQIEKKIINEALKPGDRLPSERLLAKRLGVSRPVIREATRVLAVRGLVESRQGSGTYIKEISSESASKPIERYLRLKDKINSFSNLHEIRKTLEIDIAGYAAERATEEDIKLLEKAIIDQEESKDDPEKFTQADHKYHAVLASATHNDLYLLLLSPITDIMLDFRMAAYISDPKNSIQGALTFHSQILEKIKARDANGARQAMREHLKQAEGIYQTSIAKNK